MRFFLLGLAVGTCLRGQVIFSDGFESPMISGHAISVRGGFDFGVWSGFAMSNGGNAGFVSGVDNGLAPVEGAQHYAFNGDNPSAGGWIEASFNTAGTESTEMRLTFALGRSANVGQLLHAKIEVFDLNGSHLLEELAVPDQVIGYTWFSFDFTGSGEMRLRFTDFSAANQVSDLWLDAVSVTQIGASAIPETVDWAQFAGFAVLGYSALRRRSAKLQRWRRFAKWGLASLQAIKCCVLSLAIRGGKRAARVLPFQSAGANRPPNGGALTT